MELMKAQDIAEMLDLDINTVYRKAPELGGVKFARRWIFEKQRVKDALFGEGGSDAVKEKEERQGGRVAGPGAQTRCKPVKAVRNEGSCPGPGSGVDSGTAGAGTRGNPHGLGLGNTVS